MAYRFEYCTGLCSRVHIRERTLATPLRLRRSGAEKLLWPRQSSEFGRPRRLVTGDLLRHFQGALFFKYAAVPVARHVTRRSLTQWLVQNRPTEFPSGLSLAYIGTASTIEFDVSLRVDPRRFRLGGKKEAAGMFAADA